MDQSKIVDTFDTYQAAIAGKVRSEVESLLHGRRWSSFIEAAALGEKGREVIRFRGERCEDTTPDGRYPCAENIDAAYDTH